MVTEATILIPAQWEKAADQVKDWVQHYGASVGQPLTVALIIDPTASEIWVADNTQLNFCQKDVLDAAIHVFNTEMNFPHIDPWKANEEAKARLKLELAEIRSLIAEIR